MILSEDCERPNPHDNQASARIAPGVYRDDGDHQFEWTRGEFQAWANGVAERFGYAVHLAGVGPLDSEIGSPTQMGVFSVRL